MSMNKQLRIKERIKERYGNIALNGNSESCCIPSSSEGCGTTAVTNNIHLSSITASETIGYDYEKLKSIPESSILGIGCGNPVKFAHIKEGDIVVDLGSGAGMDVFLAANVVKDSGKVIGIDMTESMVLKARNNAESHGYKNVEFILGDIEKRIPVEDNSVDVVISNCVINLTYDKVSTFQEIYRILKPNGLGRMVVSDLVTSKEIDEQLIESENWCNCINGAITKENYINSLRKAGFTDIKIKEEKPYMEFEQQKEQQYQGQKEEEKRKITSISVKAIKQ